MVPRAQGGSVPLLPKMDGTGGMSLGLDEPFLPIPFSKLNCCDDIYFHSKVHASSKPGCCDINENIYANDGDKPWMMDTG